MAIALLVLSTVMAFLFGCYVTQYLHTKHCDFLFEKYSGQYALAAGVCCVVFFTIGVSSI